MFSAFSTSFLQPRTFISTVVEEAFQVPQDTVGTSGSVNPYYDMNVTANNYEGTTTNYRDNSYPIRNYSGYSFLDLDMDADFLHGSTIYHCSRHVLSSSNNDNACYLMYADTSVDNKNLSCLMLTRFSTTNEITVVVASRGVKYLEENLTNLTNVKTEFMHSFISIFTLSSGQRRLTLKFFNEDESIAYHKEIDVPADFSTDYNRWVLNGTNFFLGTNRTGRQVQTKNCLYWDGKVLRDAEMATIVSQNT